MKFFPSLLLPLALLLALTLVGAEDGPVFEMRTYYANEGKLDDLLTRFRDHTVALFEKYGMENVGYFVPEENPGNVLVYFLSYPSRDSRKASWKGFVSDPDWKEAFAASKVHAKLVAKVESEFLTLTDYSPKLRIKESKKPRLFELRTYTTAEGMLSHLDYRFANDTLGIFDRKIMSLTGIPCLIRMGTEIPWSIFRHTRALRHTRKLGLDSEPIRNGKKLRLDPKSELEVDFW